MKSFKQFINEEIERGDSTLEIDPGGNVTLVYTNFGHITDIQDRVSDFMIQDDYSDNIQSLINAAETSEKGFIEKIQQEDYIDSVYKRIVKDENLQKEMADRILDNEDIIRRKLESDDQDLLYELDDIINKYVEKIIKSDIEKKYPHLVLADDVGLLGQ